MTSPALHRFQEKSFPPAGSNGSWILRVGFGTVLGGFFFALILFCFQKKDFAWGFFLGSFFWTLSFYALHLLTRRVFKAPEKGQGMFWFWNIVRLALIALICRFFLLVSLACLLGALASYLWFLLVLGWTQWRAAASKI